MVAVADAIVAHLKEPVVVVPEAHVPTKGRPHFKLLHAPSGRKPIWVPVRADTTQLHEAVVPAVMQCNVLMIHVDHRETLMGPPIRELHGHLPGTVQMVTSHGQEAAVVLVVEGHRGSRHELPRLNFAFFAASWESKYPKIKMFQVSPSFGVASTTVKRSHVQPSGI